MMRHFAFKQPTPWVPPEGTMAITTLDMHTGGEPLRIITGGLPGLPGNTILEKRKYIKENLDQYRKILMWEPRGHTDMYGCIITDPISEGSDFGVIFLHNEGYSTMCGHGIIAVTKAVIDYGVIPMVKPVTEVKIDSPAGLIKARGFIQDDKVERVSFMNVPSFVQALDQVIHVEGLGQVHYDLAFGGAFYAYIDATEVNVSLTSGDLSPLVEKGMAIKREIMKSVSFHHPFEEDLNFLYGTIFTGKALNKDADIRNVCVFADGEVDRSPTGTGVSGRVAIEVARGKMKSGDSITIESIVGSTFKVKVTALVDFGSYKAVIPEVEGTAFITGMHTFLVDQNDPLKNGFILR